MTIHVLTDEFDQLIKSIDTTNEEDINKARNKFCSLYTLLTGSSKNPKSIHSILSAESDSDSIKENIALLFLRGMEKKEIYQQENHHIFEPELITYICNNIPEVSRKINLEKRKQTFENIPIIENYHKTCEELLENLFNTPENIKIIIESRNNILKFLNSKEYKPYLDIFGLSELMTGLKVIFSGAQRLIKGSAETFSGDLEDLMHVIDDTLIICIRRNNFLHVHIKRFVEKIKRALNSLEENKEERFSCNIKPLSNNAIKRYPLHETERVIQIDLPLKNLGPGIANKVIVTLNSTNEKLAFNDVINLGDVPAKEFNLSFEVLIIEPVEIVEFKINIKWEASNLSKSFEEEFIYQVFSQNSDISWKELEFNDPYSTEVATGKDFYGRKIKKETLIKYLFRKQMQSTYIWGQKRIGKTSLAKAVLHELKQSNLTDFNYHTLFLEWGEFSHPNSNEAVNFLGYQLLKFLKNHLPDEHKNISITFTGALSPLIELIKILIEFCPYDRFIIVLDEFDKINFDMYHHGSLASSFFSSLRTLSSKENMAFILIGGENMPFIIDSQGDQLNKFIAEPLSYFGKDSKIDYIDMIRNEDVKSLNWYDKAIDYLFEVTNGHPYFTKCICSECYQSAIKNKDSDIILEDVLSSCNTLISKLDANAFSHYWQDGIATVDEKRRDIISLNRCKVLHAAAKLSRKNVIISVSNIENIQSISDSSQTVESILAEFCKRNILIEKNGEYTFVVKFFELWLINDGYLKIIQDEFSETKSKEWIEKEDNYFVTSTEISSLVKRFPIYRGQRVDGERVRAWIDQVETNEERRLLFNILKNTIFVSEDIIRTILIAKHKIVIENIPLPSHTGNMKRNDIAICYIDGEGKSGQYIAKRYAENNRITTKSIINSLHFKEGSEQLEKRLDATLNCLIIVDDLIATGRNLCENIEEFLRDNVQFIVDRSLRLFIVVAYATHEGAEKVEKFINKRTYSDIEIRLLVGDYIDDESLPLSDKNITWRNAEEDRLKAISLCKRLGAKLYPKNPLGFGDLGLNVVFPENCPNNSLPILHTGSKSNSFKWEPIFERLIH